VTYFVAYVPMGAVGAIGGARPSKTTKERGQRDENDGKSNSEGGPCFIGVESGERRLYPIGPAPCRIQFERPFHSHCACGEI
jgi:hypothetical protein